jgi:endonuclease/exonuclease/phosphatase family metal-dependent hydrolase
MPAATRSNPVWHLIAWLALPLVAQFGCGQNGTPSVDVKSKSKQQRPAEIKSQRADSELKQPTAIQFRLATYNINFGNPNLSAVIDAIKASDADIVCLQETNARSAAVLKLAFGKQYNYIRFNGTVKPYLAGGFAVLSRVPIVNEWFIPARHGLFGIHAFEVKLNDRELQIFSVHMQPVRIPRGGGVRNLAATLTAFSKNKETHEQEIAQVLQHVRKDRPTLIVGDFNSLTNGKAPEALRDNGFVDSFASVNEEPGKNATWHWPTKYGEIALRFDYIFHTESLRTIDSRVIKTAGSDHYLVVSQLEVD